MAVVTELIPSFPWAWHCFSARLADPEPLLPWLHVLMDAGTPSHTPDTPTARTDSCYQTVNPTLHSRIVIVHFEVEEEML